MGEGIFPYNIHKQIGVQPTSMPMDQARRVLQAVVSTHERAITPSTPLNVVAGFSTEDIRRAATTVGLDALKMHRAYHDSGFLKSNKDTSIGKASLVTFFDPRQQLNPKSLELWVFKENLSVLESKFPLTEPVTESDKLFISFLDFRLASRRTILLEDVLANPNLSDYQFLFRGVRWLFANVLDWKNDGIILPEQLETLGLAPGGVC